MKFSISTKEETSKILGSSDAYVDSMNNFNCTLITRDPLAKPEDVKDFLKECAEKMTYEVQQKVYEHMDTIKERWEDLGLPNLHINIAATSGKDAFNMPYTRFNTLFLPASYGLKGSEDYGRYLNWVSQGLLIHEFFHILSRNHPKLKDVCYEALGFKKIAPMWMDDWIMNPDCPTVEHSIEVSTHKGNAIEIVPCLRLTNKGFQGEEGWDLKAKKYQPLKSTNYFQKVGQEYSYHPEEACAEWFVRYFYGDINSDAGKAFKNALNGFFAKS